MSNFVDVKSVGAGIGLFAGVIALVAAFIGPMIYHIVWCINMADETGSAIALLIVGVIFPPLGWVHGVALTFGFTWI